MEGGAEKGRLGEEREGKYNLDLIYERRIKKQNKT